MHKANVFLEDWQYEVLQALAAQEHRSISALLREMLTSHLAVHPETARQRLDVLAGEILAAAPGARLAADQPYRAADLAIDPTSLWTPGRSDE